MKRSGKFYRNNEKEVMRSLGFTPTPNSGSGWIVKEDGQSDELICQLKSTDAKSIKLVKSDIDTLEYNALVAHKLPVFVVQFLSTNECFLVIRPEDVSDIAKYLKTGEVSDERFSMTELIDDTELTEGSSDSPKEPRKLIGSSSKGRKVFEKENAEKYKKKVKSAT